jgi:glycosyltransferase involved in cell wall biosynthesis
VILDTGTPKVSVIVPFRNAHLYLSKCIESLLSQTIPQDIYELLFIDNNSNDGGDEIVAAYSEIQLFRETKPGAYAARNCGLTHARGEIIAFTDPDCVVEKDWLERIMAVMEAETVGIILGHRVAPTNDAFLKLVMAYESQKAAYVANEGRGELFFAHTNNMAVKRRVIERVGPFPEVMRGGDTVFVRRAVDIFGPDVLEYHPEVRVCHLEVDSLLGFYKKNYIYGQSNQSIRNLVQYRSLGTPERLQIYRDTVKNEGWSWLQGIIVLSLLVPGAIFYEAGRFMTRVKRRNNEKR